MALPNLTCVNLPYDTNVLCVYGNDCCNYNYVFIELMPFRFAQQQKTLAAVKRRKILEKRGLLSLDTADRKPEVETDGLKRN